MMQRLCFFERLLILSERSPDRDSAGFGGAGLWRSGHRTGRDHFP